MQCSATSGSSSSGGTLAAIFAEARVDPAPTTDAEALAAHLFNHAEVLRQRSAALTARLEAEEAAEAAVRAESAALKPRFASTEAGLPRKSKVEPTIG